MPRLGIKGIEGSDVSHSHNKLDFKGFDIGIFYENLRKIKIEYLKICIQIVIQSPYLECGPMY